MYLRRVRWTALGVLAASLILAAPAAAGPLRLYPLHAEPDRGAGGRIVDSQGREVILRGVNVNSLVDYWQGTSFPTTFPLEPKDPARMAAFGWNAVRLAVSWSRIEPEPGVYDEKYVEWIADTVKVLRSRGLYTIVDFHQDAWGATLAGRPNELCIPPQQPNVGWDGAPGWATLDGALPRCFANFREASGPVWASWQSFLSDSKGPGGVGIQSRFLVMVHHVAKRFAQSPSVAGYDLVNEPNAYGPADLQRLSEFYGRAAGAIRHAEASAGGFPHLIFYEPSVLWSADVRGAPPPFPADRNIVYAPHLYTRGYSGGANTREPFDAAPAEADGAPVLSGEWGTDPDRAKTDTYFLDHQALQDEFRMSATLWTWRESCGDPHKVADWRAGRVPKVWGAFDVDCNTNTVTGLRDALALQLARGWVRAAPGRLDGMQYDHARGTLVAWGRAEKGDGELAAFWPRSKHGGVRAVARGLGRPQVNRAPGGGVIVSAQPRGGDWTIAVGGGRASRRTLAAAAAAR